MKRIKDVPKLLQRLATMPGNYSAADFQGLKESISHLVMLRDTLGAASQVQLLAFSSARCS